MAVIVISGVDVNLVTDNLSTIVLFPSVLVESDDASAVLTATLTASDATNGGFTADSLLASGFTDLGDGTYTYSGTAAEMTAALQLLVFEPAAESTASGASAAIAYTIDVTEPAGGSASSSVDITIEVADGPGVPTPDQYDTVIYGDAGDNPLVGTSGNDWIEGGAGRDNIDAGAGDDYIIAGTGGDWWVKGGSGADIFQFSVGDYGVKIADWEDGVDKIFLAGGLTYADLEKLTYTGTGLTTVVYRTSNGDRLMFYNMDPTLIDEDDFLTEADFLDANTAPVAVADAPSGDEDTVISGAVTATDADGDAVTFSLVSDATSGVVTVNTDGTYTYTPSADFNGTDSFEVLADDGNGGTDTVTVSVTVNGVNDAPVALDDSAATDEGASVVISLLANDSDADGDTLSLSAISAAGNGTVVDNGDGTVTYTPTSGFSGTDSFSYTVSDGNGGTATATATVTVSAAPVNTAPVAVDDSAATDEGASVVISLLANDSDADGDTLSLSAISAAGNGTVVDNGDGTVTYTPTTGFSGTDSFSYTVSDGNGSTATATATVTVEATTTPSTGVPTPDQYDTVIYGDAGDNPLVGTSGNDWIEGGAGRDNIDAGAGDDYIIAGTGGDWWVKGGSGADIFQFSVGDYGVKIADWEDGVDKIFLAGGLTYADLEKLTYTGTGLTTVVYRTSNGDRLMFYNMDPTLIDEDDFLTEADFLDANNAPVAVADAPSGDEDTVISGAVTATDADGDTVTFSLASDATSGVVTVNADGTYTYTPGADFNGTDSFEVLADDGNGGTDTVTVSVTVNGVNDAPVAVDDSAATDEGASVVISLLANDSDADGDALSLSALGAAGNGTVVDNGDGTVTYTPTSGFSGTDSFSYTVSDGNGGSATATATVTVSAAPVNTAPVAVDDSAATDEGASVVISLLANDSDADGDTLSLSALGAAGNGIVVDNGDGTVTYTPTAGFSGTDSFGYTVSDGNGGTATATATVTVSAAPVNTAPAAVDDSAATDEGASVIISLLANDSDADGDTLSLSALGAAGNGTVVDNGDGTVTYTPTTGFSGTDSFGYTVSDGNGGTATATATVTVSAAPVNTAPVAVDDSAATDEGASVIISLLANDSDADGDALSLSALGAVGNGTVVDNGEGTVTYTPTSGFSGTDSFSYTVSDGNGGTATATATVTVSAAPVNTAPVAVDDSAATDEGASVIISLLANDSDADGDTLSLSALGAAGNGTVVNNGDGTVTYTPTSGFSGTDSFSYTVSDGNGGTATATATVTVEATTTPSTGVPTPDQYDTVIYGDEGDNPLVGTSGNDWIDAGDGRDNLNAGAGDDYIIAGKGGDWWVKGGSGADIFQFSVGDYGVKIADWEDGVDKIFLAGGLTYADLTRDTYTGTGLTTVVFRTSNGDRLMFYNMDPTLIDADDFLTEADYTAVGNAPVAVADAPSGNEDTTISGAVTATDADGDTVTFSLVSDATSGSVTVNTDGTYSYMPDANFNGTDSFEVSAADGNGNSDTVTVSVSVAAVNDAPVAVDDTATTDAGASVTFSLVANDSDVDGDSLSISSLGSVANGTLVNNGDGTVTYTPDAGFTGVDSFDYTISDGNGGTATASATVGVDEVILPGTGKEILLVVTMGQSLSVGTTTWANREVLSTEAVYPDTVLGLDFGNSQNNSWGWRESAVDVTDYQGLTSWVETQTETHASAMLNTLTAQYEANGQEAPTLLHFNVGIPGKSILSLSAESDQIYSSMSAALAATQEGDLFIVQSGTTYSYYANSGGGTTYSYGTQSHPYAFDNFKVQLELAYNEAISQGYTVQDRIVINFIQGQSDANQTDDEYGYRFLLQNLMDNADDYADSLFGYDVETISIVSQHRGYAAKDVAFDQISYVTDNASAYFGAPEFQFEASEPASVGGDYTHLSSEGYYMMGSTIGLKLYEALEGTGDDPILISSVDVQNGNEILVTFSGLEGSLVDDPYSAYREGVGLVPPENFGFSIANASGTYSGSLAAITSVEIVGANQVLITADQDLTDSFVLYLGRNDSEDLADDVISPGAGDGFGGTTLRDSEVDVALDPTSGRVLDDEFIYEYAPIQSFDVTVDLLV